VCGILRFNWKRSAYAQRRLTTGRRLDLRTCGSNGLENRITIRDTLWNLEIDLENSDETWSKASELDLSPNSVNADAHGLANALIRDIYDRS
jgi:hypothetical protein